MKLTDHVNHIRSLIYKAYNNRFARLGLGEKNEQDISLIPEELHSLRVQLDEMLENHIGETGSYKLAREKALDELSFTLFNRIAAIKVMEARHLFPEIITKRTEHGDRSFAHKAWLEINPNGRDLELEGLEFFLEYEFDKLSEKMQLFGKEHPYALMPFTIDLNDIIDAFNAVEQDKDTGADTWKSDDILGWLYESYNSLKKKEHKESKANTEYDKVSLQSQVYTPRWVVKFLVDNSLGKLYLEMFSNSQIKEKYAIANAPQTRVREKKPLHEIKLIDPAPGSGNFLLYAFDLFYDLYIDQIDNYGAEYDEDEIPALIIGNNLYGIDLDDRAVQLAQMGLFIKALTKQRGFIMKYVNVVSSDFYLPKYAEVKLFFEEGANFDQAQKELMEEVWTDLQQAYRFGSLIKVGERVNERLEKLEKKNHKTETLNLFETQNIVDFQIFRNEFFTKLEQAVARYAQSKNNNFLKTKANDALTFLKILANKYDVAVANPPYTDSGDFGPELKIFIDNNYNKPWKFNSNLYVAFIKKCSDLINENGKIGMIHPLTFMYIKSFEDVRKFILDKFHISVFVDYGLSNLFGLVMVDPAFYVLEKGITTIEKSWFISLDQYTRTPQEKFKKEYALAALENYINGETDKHNFLIPQSKLKIIKTWPFIYWISDEFRGKFKEKSVKDLLKNCQGLATANNDRFLRYWWEVDSCQISTTIKDGKKWVFYAKGGPYKKWNGNLWLLVNWENNGEEIRNFRDVNGKQRSRPQNEQYYFNKGITYSASSTKGISFRLLPENKIFDVKGSSIFINQGDSLSFNYSLALFNSSLSSYILKSLNGTVETQVGDIQRIPIIIPSKNKAVSIEFYSERNIEITDHLLKNALCEPNYHKSILLSTIKSDELISKIKVFLCWENNLKSQVIINETIINEEIFEVYDLNSDDRAMVISKEGESIGLMPVEQAAKESYLAEKNDEFPLNHIKTFLEELPEKTFTVAEKEAIVCEFPNLYKSNNDLEEFCIRHQVNPINVWYWFKQSKVVPVHRAHDITMEFLADLLREVLMEDDDGIVPLVRNSGEEVLVNRIEKKFFEKGFSTAQYSQLRTLLGREIDEYINNHFFRNFSDHLNLYPNLPKTPFIWHITSGKHGAFEAYIIIYKWSKDKLFTIKSVYVEKRESALRRELQDAANSNSVTAQEARELIPKQLDELHDFNQKIDELLAGGYDPKLDDGVGKNIAPLQKRGMITYEVLNPGQLEKYLNADW